MPKVSMTGSARFSPCRRYRYALWRSWGDPRPFGSPCAMFVCLNPSTADETQDDPTLRRCIAFARAWGFSALCMTNLFAYRATDPADMLAQADPVGEANDPTLRATAKMAGVIIAAWGVHGSYLGRGAVVRAMLPKLHYLRLTKAGHPAHPLYLPRSLVPAAWS